MHDEVFTIPARRCKRCGGLLTSSQGLRDGYGPCCLRKIKQEEADRKMMENQCSLFDIVKPGGGEAETEKGPLNGSASRGKARPGIVGPPPTARSHTIAAPPVPLTAICGAAGSGKGNN
jgi:hypothetical protein